MTCMCLYIIVNSKFATSMFKDCAHIRIIPYQKQRKYISVLKELMHDSNTVLDKDQ